MLYFTQLALWFPFALSCRPAMSRIFVCIMVIFVCHCWRNANFQDETVLPLAPTCALCECQIAGLPRPRGLLSSPASRTLLSFFTCSDPTYLILLSFLVLLSHSRTFLPRCNVKDVASLVFSPNNLCIQGLNLSLVPSCTFLILKITICVLCALLSTRGHYSTCVEVRRWLTGVGALWPWKWSSDNQARQQVPFPLRNTLFCSVLR